MKDQRAKRTSERLPQAAGKSVYQLYRELLFLREEVRVAEKRASGPRRKSVKPRDKRAYDA